MLFTIYCNFEYTSVKIKPALKENILKFGFGINYKYEGMLTHSFNRFYVVKELFYPLLKIYNFLSSLMITHVHM